ncbi:neutral zinc metallopeptidase [Nocardioides sp.]|uniref:KPN_02809 family neutral zinc metallopeptidase n=1 Tax=Nocardioides sp. TaxID=35761 RepID=UPI00199C1B23|nr:neutral zinc metallopeptidase [Nocardioides sp.]MBC7277281.1 neutral zinc metallopeptidase [Nocardioides sp.]
MRFNPKARLDTSRTSGGGGRGGFGGGGGGARIPIPGGRAGGGIGTVIVLLIFFLVTQCTGVGPQVLGDGGGSTSVGTGTFGGMQSAEGGNTGDFGSCRTGEDANNDEYCALVALENSMTGYWDSHRDLSGRFQPEQAVVIFSDQVQTGGCGAASSSVGPFYCPADQTIYLDPTFFDSIFEQLGGQDTTFVRAYVLAHEYGHHIQNLLGTMGQVRTQQGPDSDAVRLELQADCYAGMWTAAAEGDGFIQDITEQDIAEGIDAAKTVGDDHIQSRTTGRVDTSSFTHGSSEQRIAWFRKGMTNPDSIAGCDTFRARDLDNP